VKVLGKFAQQVIMARRPLQAASVVCLLQAAQPSDPQDALHNFCRILRVKHPQWNRNLTDHVWDLAELLVEKGASVARAGGIVLWHETDASEVPGG
jgi:hypothetical protein